MSDKQTPEPQQFITEAAMAKNDGGPAFPVTASTGDPRDGVYCRDGMSLRDWFAGQETLGDWDDSDATMSDELSESLAGPKPEGGWSKDKIGMMKWEARWRSAIKYIRADAMLKASGQ